MFSGAGRQFLCSRMQLCGSTQPTHALTSTFSLAVGSAGLVQSSVEWSDG